MWVKDPQQQEEYWQRLVKVTRELDSLRPALLAADANESVTSVSTRASAGWPASPTAGVTCLRTCLPNVS